MRSINHKCNLVMYGNHFTFKELIVTDTDIPNYPVTDEHLYNLASLWRYLNFVREKFGKSIIVNSAYRTEQVNKQVGGTKRSYHMQGRAADIRPKDLSDLDELYSLVKKQTFWTECIKYPTFIHVAI